MSDMDDIVKEFLVESNEGLDQLDRNLVALEQSPGNKDLLAGIFRCIHTIKGTSGFLGFGRLESVTHVGESLLSDLRDGKKALTPEITSALLKLVDALRAIMAAIEEGGTDGTDDFAGLVDLLTRLQKGETAAPGKAEGAGSGRKARKSGPVGCAGPRPRRPKRWCPEAPQPEVAVEAARASHTSDSNIRVDVGLLDKLMNLVGELVLARNQILQFTAAADGCRASSPRRSGST